MFGKEKEIKRVKITPPKVSNKGLSFGFIISLLSAKRLPYILGFCFIVVIILNPYFGVNTKFHKIGELVDRDIKAPFSISVVDKESTEKEILIAENSVLPVYDYDNYNEENFNDSIHSKRIREAFSLMREKYENAGASGAIKVQLSKYELDLLKKDFDEKLGVIIPHNIFLAFADRTFQPRLERNILLLLKNIKKEKIMSKKDLDNIDMNRGIILSKVRGEKEQQLPFKNFNEVLTTDQALTRIKENISAMPQKYPKSFNNNLMIFFEKFITPTLTFNREKTEGLIEKARQNVKPVVFNIRKGEMIIRDGAFISKKEHMIFNAIKEKSIRRSSIAYLIGAFILIFLFYITICSFASRFIKKFKSENKDILIMGISLIILLLFFKIFSSIIPAVGNEFGQFPNVVWLYIFPFAIGAMIIRLLFNSETAIVYAIFSSLLFGIYMEKNLFFTIYVFFSSIIAAGMVGYAQDRAVLLKAGLKTGIYNVMFVLVLNLLGTITEPFNFKMVFYGSLAAFTGGILSALLTYGVIPILEWALKHSTDIRLLELANLNHPLLRELMVQCPGTYHHSMVVGNLVETAAEAIRANSLFARVAAYYHDIGKLRKPEYFIENIKGKENKHDKLTPNMSALILISHIKDGVELADEYVLGDGIRDVIRQHHGTTLIKFFYHKAVEMAPESTVVDENEFRYPGSQPQTKEAALVMIADQVEASVRALSEPSHSRIKGVVQTIIDNLFSDGQFDQCDLTLRDLNIIGLSFVRVLTGMHHQRIDYPFASKGVEKNEINDKAKEEEPKDNKKGNKIINTNTIGRLGERS